MRATHLAPVAEEFGVETTVTVQDDVAYSLEDLEGLALRRHPGLFEALARIEAARGRSWQAGLPPNPSVGYTASEVGNEGSAGQQGAFISQQYVRGGKLQLARAVACQDVRRLHQEYHVMRQRVLTDVRASFYSLFWLQRRIDLLERFRDTNRQAAEIAGRLLRNGDNTRSDVLLAEIELEQTISDLVALKMSFAAGWRELARIVGDSQLAPARLTEPGAVVPEISWDEALAMLRHSPQIAAAEAEVSRTQMALQRAIAEPIPNVNTQFSLQYDFSTDHTVAGIQVGMPIPTRNRNQGGIHEARANVTMARQTAARIRLSIEKKLAGKFGTYQNARVQVDRMKTKITPKAEEVVRIAFEAYEAGELSMSDVLNAQRSLLRATLRQQDAEKQLRSSYIEMEGFLLADSLGADS